jgi:hypothetical protein
MRILALSFAVALLATACGGKVAVDLGGAGGAPVGSGPSCVEVCDKVAAVCNTTTPAECATSCAKLNPALTAACPDAWEAWLTCSDNNPPQCQSNTGPCETEFNALMPCISQICTNSPSTCM